MAFYQTYIYAAVQNAIDQSLSAPTQPAVAPQSAPIFSDDIMQKLSFYKDKALSVMDFESWMLLLENVAAELKLNPATDFQKIAAVLNLYRVENNLEPL
jgi:hypothetical protein